MDQAQIHQKELDKLINSNETEKNNTDASLETKWQNKKNEITQLNVEIGRLDQSNTEELKNKEKRYEEEIYQIKSQNDDKLNSLNDDIMKRQTELKELEQYNNQEITEVNILHTKEFTQ